MTLLRYSCAVPYTLQRVLAALALVVLAPPLVAVAIIARARHGAPVLYRGIRYGRNRVPFEQFKFRSMVNDADSLLDANGDANIARITEFGGLLRRTSVDEIPQLINIVRGDMAIVGPRPLIDKVFERVDEDHPRFDVLPGLTGLAQINGRNFTPWSQRLEFDAQYAKNRSFAGDVKILAHTVVRVLSGSDIAADRNSKDVLDI